MSNYLKPYLSFVFCLLLSLAIPALAVDSDGDGVQDDKDSYPDNPSLIGDIDQDGIDDLNDTEISIEEFHMGERMLCFRSPLDVVCIGVDNSQGQLDVPLLANPRALSTNYKTSCAIDDTGVVCWGYNNWGQADPPELSNPVEISMGRTFGCAIDGTTTVCWAAPFTPVYANVPEHLSAGGVIVVWDNVRLTASTSLPDTWYLRNEPAMTNVTHTGSSLDFICALGDEGIKCWGRGLWDTTKVPPLDNPVTFDTGISHSCAIDDTGVVCWGGRNLYRQLTPPPLSNPTQVAVGDVTSCAVDDTGLVCWGMNYEGYLTLTKDYRDKDLDGLFDYYDDYVDGDNDQLEDYSEDNCPDISNYLQHDNDNDGIGNACDYDIDGDGYENDEDSHPLNPDLYTDHDRDLLNSHEDNCSNVSNYLQSNIDGDYAGDACDLDIDGDSFNNDVDDHPLNMNAAGDPDNDKVDSVNDNCPFVSNYFQSDTDSDGKGNACDTDLDGDGVPNDEDSHPLNSGLFTDHDGDLINAYNDNCPDIINPVQSDSDGDGIGNACDPDVDGDGVDDVSDSYPLNPNLW